MQSYYEDVFDYMIELPYGNSAHKDGFHGMNIWQVFHCTPYKETIYPVERISIQGYVVGQVRIY